MNVEFDYREEIIWSAVSLANGVLHFHPFERGTRLELQPTMAGNVKPIVYHNNSGPS